MKFAAAEGDDLHADFQLAVVGLGDADVFALKRKIGVGLVGIGVGGAFGECQPRRDV